MRIIHNATPVGGEGNGSLSGVRFAYTQTQDGKLVTLDEGFALAADQLFEAIGQKIDGVPEGLAGCCEDHRH